jgi:hypothetical protein
MTTAKNSKSKIVFDSYLATAYVEGFCEGEGASLDEQIEAWAYLIKTGLCWQLQGWFGRAASAMIKKGLISKEGVINYDKLEDIKKG